MTMLIYPKKQGRTNVPEWRKDKFLRLRGFIDALLRKTDFVVTESGTQLAGAYYIRVQRELQVVEDAKVASCWIHFTHSSQPGSVRGRKPQTAQQKAAAG